MLNVGFLGLGFISNEHVLGYLGSDDAEIVAVCDLDEQRARLWLQKWKLPRAHFYVNLDEMLASEDLDIVEVLAPHYLHCQQAVKCAEAKIRGISVQKPMAVGLRECDRMIADCRENGVLLRLYENYVFYPVYQRAKELIQDDLIGELMSIRIHTMAGLRQGAPWPPYWDPNTALFDLQRCQNSPLVGDDGLHKFSLACWFMEREIEQIGAWIDPTTPLDAPAYVRARFKALPGDGPKYAQLDFTFSTRLAIPCDHWLDDFIEICGEKGAMWINQCAAAGNRALFRGNEMSQSPLFPPIVVFVNGKATSYLADISPQDRNWSTSFVGCTRSFIDVLQDGGQPVCTGEEGKNFNRYAIASLLSAQEKRDVQLDEVTSEAESAGRLKLITNFCNRQ
jgi:predicted dehydrogenase